LSVAITIQGKTRYRHFNAKYSEAEFPMNKAETIKLRDRDATFKQETDAKGILWPMLITTYDLKVRMHSSTIVATLIMDDLFK